MSSLEAERMERLENSVKVLTAAVRDLAGVVSKLVQVVSDGSCPYEPIDVPEVPNLKE